MYTTNSNNEYTTSKQCTAQTQKHTHAHTSGTRLHPSAWWGAIPSTHSVCPVVGVRSARPMCVCVMRVGVCVCVHRSVSVAASVDEHIWFLYICIYIYMFA